MIVREHNWKWGRDRERERERKRERDRETETDVSFISYMCWCFSTDEGVYVDTNGKLTKDTRLQWGESPTSVGKCRAVPATFLSVGFGHVFHLTLLSSLLLQR